jgi:hypothetical protein
MFEEALHGLSRTIVHQLAFGEQNDIVKGEPNEGTGLMNG